MPETFSITQAKNNLTAIIHRVETGPAVQITRRGKPVAILVPLKEYERLSRRQNNFHDAMMASRQSLEEDGVEMTGEDFEGLRDKTIGRDTIAIAIAIGIGIGIDAPALPGGLAC